MRSTDGSQIFDYFESATLTTAAKDNILVSVFLIFNLLGSHLFKLPRRTDLLITAQPQHSFYVLNRILSSGKCLNL